MSQIWECQTGGNGKCMTGGGKLMRKLSLKQFSIMCKWMTLIYSLAVDLGQSIWVHDCRIWVAQKGKKSSHKDSQRGVCILGDKIYTYRLLILWLNKIIFENLRQEQTLTDVIDTSKSVSSIDKYFYNHCQTKLFQPVDHDFFQDINCYAYPMKKCIYRSTLVAFSILLY